ncbi:hypothetical protein AB6A40_006296 [Gnathostoma spinigerum]|uniref:Large ribosomal subunit protein mL45 n=1 Tax=Gnathostoma spinigerum TaxID=75299 RepID=A0ABD6EK74_9BILA
MEVNILQRILGCGPKPFSSHLLRPFLFTCDRAAFVHHHKERHNLERFLGIRRSNPNRANRNTNVNEYRFRRLRGRKIVAIELPDEEENRKLRALPPAEMRMAMLKKGINPYKEVTPRNWTEHQVTFQSLYSVVDPYLPPEEPLPFINVSSPSSSLSDKAGEMKERILHRWHNYKNGIRRIRKKEGFEKFDPKKFGPTAETIYVEAHKALMMRDKTKLFTYITEHAFGKMWPDVEKGSIAWEMVDILEPSVVVSLRCIDYPSGSGNDIAQITVRMHTKQKLAIFDRFGRLILGSEKKANDVIEYVVFENHIASMDGLWRLHDKVYPKWMKPKQPVIMTAAINELSDESRPSETKSLPIRVEENKKLLESKEDDA